MIEQDKPNVLIVDDEKSNLKVLSEILKDQAHVLIAKNGQQALARAKQVQPTLILLDVVMPEMDGFDVILALKNNEATRDIPVIFITGLSDVDNEEKGFLLGACDYIQKPFHAAIVKARVKLHLQLAHQRILLAELASIDALSGLNNRRKFDEILEVEFAAAKRDRTQLAILMIDIDYFKPYNDHYGHRAGDEVIRKVAKVIHDQFCRPRDFVARYGGEEFVVILPNTCGEDIPLKLDLCCKAVSSLNIVHEYSSVSDCITVSIGGVGFRPETDCKPDAIVEAAAAHLYLAKDAGRDQAKWLVLENRN